MANTRGIPLLAAALAAALTLIGPAAGSVSAQAVAPQERLCDPTFEDCRADILTYIAQETVEIGMGFWMMTDARYANALVAAWQRGVRIRLLMDPRCGAAHAACNAQNDQLQAAGIPMRNRATSGILHWKVALFAGQGQVQFAGANYAPFELTPETPYVNYTDEIVYFTNNPSIVQSFMTKFDDLWTSPTEFVDYANITAPLVRSYPTYPIDPQLNFPPEDSYRARSTAAYAAETQAIDVLMFRITDERQSDAIIAAVNRGVPVRLITDIGEYRNTARLWDSYNVDKLYHAGVQVRVNGHQGINHEKAVLLRNSGTSIFGSSNWTSPSTDSQREHNMFSTQPWMFTWLENQFTRKWTNSTGYLETKPFVPLPPDAPVPNAPVNGATGVPTTGMSLSFYAGLWAHLYDIYFGTTPNPPLFEANKRLGPSQYASDYRYYALPALQPGTTYYWKVVSKTMAYLTAEGPVSSFVTAGTGVSPSVTLTSPANGATFTAPASITIAATATDSSGTVAKVDFYAGTTLLGTATTAPYTIAWNNVAAGSYSLTAVATNNLGASTTSAAVSVTVSVNQPPTVAITSPANGAAFSAPASTTITASASDSDGTVTKVDFYVGATLLGTATAAPYSIAWNNVGEGTYRLTAVATDNLGATTTSAAVTVTVNASATGLPTGWSSLDVGSVPFAGSSSFSGGTFTLTGSGADVWGTADQFQYAYRSLTGDGTIVARVASVQNVASWVKAGIMIRETLNTGSAHAFMLVSAAKGVAFQRRQTTGGTSVNSAGSLSAAPQWVKLARAGNTFSAYESADGVTWTLVGTDTIPMGAMVFIGLGVTSHNTTATATCTFDSVTVQ